MVRKITYMWSKKP